MHYASLASGSRGNCHAISAGGQTLLIDAGISLRQIKLRMESLGMRHADVLGVAITHEHSDHSNAIPVILNRTAWSILAVPDTLAAIEADRRIEVPTSRWLPLKPGSETRFGPFSVLPFSIPHDVADPVAFRIEADGAAIAVMTDLGQATRLAAEYAKGLDVLVVESNHDMEMLREGRYPDHLKARIMSRVGHLSNDACAAFLGRVLSPSVKHVVLAHLSEENNDPALARLSAGEAIAKTGHSPALHVALQDVPLEVGEFGGARG